MKTLRSVRCLHVNYSLILRCEIILEKTLTLLFLSWLYSTYHMPLEGLLWMWSYALFSGNCHFFKMWIRNLIWPPPHFHRIILEIILKSISVKQLNCSNRNLALQGNSWLCPSIRDVRLPSKMFYVMIDEQKLKNSSLH